MAKAPVARRAGESPYGAGEALKKQKDLKKKKKKEEDKKKVYGFSLGLNCGSQKCLAVMNPTSIHEDVDLIPGLSQWDKRSGIAISSGACCRPDLALALLWMWLGWQLQLCFNP